MTPPQQILPTLHEIRDRIDSITYAFLELRGDESSCFGLIQAKAPRQPALRKKAKLMWRSAHEGVATNTVGYLVEGKFFMLSR